jgi:hypothetical protein
VFQNEANRDSIFDPLKLRIRLWNEVEQGQATLQCKSCVLAKVLWIQPQGQESHIEPPWEEWSRVFQWVGPAPNGVKWTVYWFPAHIKRSLPPRGKEVGPANLNGGYCFPCNPLSIVVYRFEEATRVLLHEVLHAACTDPPQAPLPWKEAVTETWAELFLVALCSKGDTRKAAELWNLQSQWIANQNAKLQNQHSVRTMKDYAWRYTLGREHVLHRLGMELPLAKHEPGDSSRLTHPSLCV